LKDEAYLRSAYIVMCSYVNCTRALIWILYLCVADQHGVTTPLLRVVLVSEKLTLILNREVMNPRKLHKIYMRLCMQMYMYIKLKTLRIY